MSNFVCVTIVMSFIKHLIILFLLLDKLASRSQRVAHYLLNKLGGGKALVPGDRVSDYWY